MRVALLLTLTAGCTLVPRSRVDRLLDADRDGWLADVDCDSSDPTQGGTELIDDAVDNDCDGYAEVDLRNWPVDDSSCWIGAAGTALNPVLIAEGSFTDPSDGSTTQADRVLTVPEVDGDGIPERAWVSNGSVTWQPTALPSATFAVQGEPALTAAWGGIVQGCPTVLVAGVDDVQPSWIAVRRVDLCTGSVRATWTFGNLDRTFSDVHVLNLGTDFWPEVLLAQPYRDAPTLGIQYRSQPDAPEAHEHFDVRIRGDAAPFAEHVASGDMNEDNVEELLVSGPAGAWLLPGTSRPGSSDVVQELDITEAGILLPTGPVAGLAFRDLDRNGSREALVAIATETGVLVYAFDIDGTEVAVLAAPPGTCDSIALTDSVLVSGGAAYSLP